MNTLPDCPRCNVPLKYYDGALGYESYVCPQCNWDVNTAREKGPMLLAALQAAVERMEAVSESIPVHNRHKGVSQASHVRHMAGHLGQHAKIARTAIANLLT